MKTRYIIGEPTEKPIRAKSGRRNIYGREEGSQPSGQAAENKPPAPARASVKKGGGQQGSGGFIWEIETDLLEPVVVGNGLAFYLKGWCYHTQHTIKRLEIITEGRHYHIKDHSSVRFDVLNEQVASKDSIGNSLLSGFAVIIPFEAIQSPRQVSLQLVARLDNHVEVSANIGALQLLPREPKEARLSLAPNPTGEPLVTICMATYNPNPDLFENQIRSILRQSHQNWVCVISDDLSQPHSFKKIKEVVSGDKRFFVYQNSVRLGVYRNFEQSLTLVPQEAEFVMFSDQDDEWDENKISTLIQAFDQRTNLVYSDMRILSTKKQVLANTFWVSQRNNYKSLETLLFANTVTGAASMFRSNLLADILPFPNQIGDAYHDHWVACVALAKGKIKYINQPLYTYIQHAANVYGFQKINSHHLFSGASYLAKSFFTPARLVEQAGAVIRNLDNQYYTYLPKLGLIAKTILIRSSRLENRKKAILKRFANLSPLALFSEGVKSKLSNRPSLGFEWFGFKACLAHRISKIYYAHKKAVSYKLAFNNLAVAQFHIVPGTQETQYEQDDLTGSARMLEQMIAPIKVDVSSEHPERVNLVMATINFKYVFGGYIAMFNLAHKLHEMGYKPRIVIVEPCDYDPEAWAQEIAAYPGLEDLFDYVETAYVNDRSNVLPVNPKDVLIATSCWTAHIASSTARAMGREKIVFFAQEYEPMFFPMGSFSALAHQSYDLPQFTVFSTDLLQEFFKNNRYGVFKHSSEFGSQNSIAFNNAINTFYVTEEILRERTKKRLLFYARPEQHASRNMFELGLLGLKTAIHNGLFELSQWEFDGIGTVGPQKYIKLGKDVNFRLLPKVSLQEYRNLLPSYDIGISLMLTPHPSLMPLDMAAAGMLVVTNTYANKTSNKLSAISSNIIPVEPTIDGIVAGLANSISRVDQYTERVAGAKVKWPTSWSEAFNDEFFRKLGSFIDQIRQEA